MATEVTPPAAAPPERGRRRRQALPPRVADGVELLSEFEDSGFKDPPHLARRADGQVIQLTRLLHLVAEAADGQRDAAAMADVVTERFGRRVSEDNIAFLVDRKLRPLGVLAAADGSSPKLQKSDPLLALRYRTALVPSGAVQRVAPTTSCSRRWRNPTAARAAPCASSGWIPRTCARASRPERLAQELLCRRLGSAWVPPGHCSACRPSKP